MSLYDYGDLNGLIKAHFIKQKAIPEPFIWHTLICLMKAAVQLEEQARSRPNNTDTDVIVVFDMKPGNILLAAPERTSMFPIYPRPHIADVGGGVLTNKDDFGNRVHGQRIVYTRGYKAPEMWRPHQGLSADATILESSTAPIRGTWTNVWQIGRVIEQMMKLIPKFADIVYQPGQDEEAMTPGITDWPFELPGQNYSMILRKLVAQCLSFHPEERPSPQIILSHIDKPGFVLFNGMDSFGNDAWFQQQQLERTAAGPKKAPKPTTLFEGAALRDTEVENQRRLYQARAYLRAWGPIIAAEFGLLGP
ncbi:unnamed protein product [Aureobasidium vineae]|uniref:Protein kinase domain-containing protein n=1 Tax=Aureobasidium vineae TaxID=2773715 RepID=A0A9N8K1U0_9PEZI|nr:unnamed protein product [Aureobasidium vineae]